MAQRPARRRRGRRGRGRGGAGGSAAGAGEGAATRPREGAASGPRQGAASRSRRGAAVADDRPRAVVVMGVSGSGKTSVGKAVAAKLGYEFLDADDFHSEHNVAKMASGRPLSDEDRMPWLAAVRDAMGARLERGEGVVMACSALRRSYREILRQVGERVCFVYLRAGKGLIAKRLTRRSGHFFAPTLLDSQFSTLEEPDPGQERDVYVVDATLPRQRMPGAILAAWGRRAAERAP